MAVYGGAARPIEVQAAARRYSGISGIRTSDQNEGWVGPPLTIM